MFVVENCRSADLAVASNVSTSVVGAKGEASIVGCEGAVVCDGEFCAIRATGDAPVGCAPPASARIGAGSIAITSAGVITGLNAASGPDTGNAPPSSITTNSEGSVSTGVENGCGVVGEERVAVVVGVVGDVFVAAGVDGFDVEGLVDGAGVVEGDGLGVLVAKFVLESVVLGEGVDVVGVFVTG